MTKFEYMLHSINNGNYLKRQWLLLTFGILAPDSLEGLADNDLTTIIPEKGNKKQLAVKIGEETQPIEDFVPEQPLFAVNERFLLPANTLGMNKEAVETTYGIFIINAIMLYYPYGGAVEYINGKMEPKALNQLAHDLLKKDEVTVEQHIRFENAASFITCLTQVAVPSASRKSITPNKEIKKRRDELLKEYKDQLHDPAIVAKIQGELAQMDKDALKDDPSAGFFIKGKSFGVTRLKTMGMYGAEQDLEDDSKITVMTPSLTEGWDVDNMPMLINTLRGGSFSRGQETALGGESTKITTRIFQNFSVVGEDCGTSLGLTVTVTDDNYDQFVGRFIVGQDKPLSKEKLGGMVNKTITLRSPIHCIQPGTDICKTCIGAALAESSVGLNAQAVRATSAFMGIFMAAMHGTTLSTERYNVQNRLS